MTSKGQFEEPAGEDQPAGYRTYKRAKSPYERFRAYLYLDGLADVKGMFVQELPSGGASNASKQMYDEFFLVIEGRGRTEIWREGSAEEQVFEWQPGTLFMAPLNAWHRHINATSAPALLLASNNAPPVFNIYHSRQFVFENPYDASLRLTDAEDFFRPKTPTFAPTPLGDSPRRESQSTWPRSSTSSRHLPPRHSI